MCYVLRKLKKSPLAKLPGEFPQWWSGPPRWQDHPVDMERLVEKPN
jgi:hypothetical protein